jgi:NADH:ubiquinone oxidoreductase subunit F (NADH-binding)
MDAAAVQLTTLTAEFPTGSLPGIEPRLLLRADHEREDLHAYRHAGGYAPGRLEGHSLIDAVESAGLRGRGGAAFPAGAKLRSVADRHGPRFVIANGAEGEPASVKDRWLMRTRPHLVIDGLLLAARSVEADLAYLYVSDAQASESLALALEEIGATSPAVELFTVPETYVAGEETSAVRAIGGGVAKPVAKPPRPFESGIKDQPTLIANVETLSHMPFIAAHGHDAYRSLGTMDSAGTVLMTISGHCERPGLYEVPLGIPLGEAIEDSAGLLANPRGLLMGGFFGGLLSPRALEIPLTYDDLRNEGSGLGCAAIVVLGPEDCAIAAAVDVMSYFARENARQCGSCMNGTAAMRDALLKLADGSADQGTVDRLHKWSVSLRRRGACALLDGATGHVGSLLREFPEEVAAHLGAACDRCAALVTTETQRETRYRINY